MYASIRPADCAAPPAEIETTYRARNFGPQQCPAPDGWRLFIVSSDANSWIDLVRAGFAWSGERAIVYDSPIGNFPSVGGSSKVEWRRDDRSRAIALIIRVRRRIGARSRRSDPARSACGCSQIVRV